MDIKKFLEEREKKKPGFCRDALVDILTRYTQPAFGSLPKREIDILMFEVMRDIGLLQNDASIYDLMATLRITRAKASQLLFDEAIRQFEKKPKFLEKKVKDALCTARFHQDKDKYFILEVEDPLVNAYLKEKVRKTGYISDSSFNTALIRLPLDAIADLISELLPEDRQSKVKKALVKAGAPADPSFGEVIKSSFKCLGRKYVGDAADGIVDKAGDFLGPILRGSIDKVGKQWRSVLKDDSNDGTDSDTSS